MRKWLFLGAAIASEVTGSLSLKAALENPGWYALVAVGYGASFVFLSLVLRTGLALGVAYGIWGALGVAATAILAAVIFGEPLTSVMLLGMVMIVCGVLTVEVGSRQPANKHANQPSITQQEAA